MSFPRSLPVILVASLAALAVADEKIVDPATIKDKVAIKVGKSLQVKFDQKGNVLSNPKVVDAKPDEPKTITLNFRQQDDMLILVTKNGFTKDLKFRALARHKGRDDFRETSIVPVKAGLFGIELWQEPIEKLILFDWKLINETP